MYCSRCYSFPPKRKIKGLGELDGAEAPANQNYIYPELIWGFTEILTTMYYRETYMSKAIRQ
jgi:hypothetical protein